MPAAHAESTLRSAGETAPRPSLSRRRRAYDRRPRAGFGFDGCGPGQPSVAEVPPSRQTRQPMAARPPSRATRMRLARRYRTAACCSRDPVSRTTRSTCRDCEVCLRHPEQLFVSALKAQKSFEPSCAKTNDRRILASFRLTDLRWLEEALRDPIQGAPAADAQMRNSERTPAAFQDTVLAR